MKIKLNKTPQDNTQKTGLNRVLDKRIKLPNRIRLGVIGIIIALLVFSTYSATATDEETKTSYKTDVIYTYSQNGVIDYTIHLTDNTVYDGRKTIKPQDSLIAFRNIVDHINGSFSYTFTSSINADIKGDYKINAIIRTDIWTKQFELAKGSFDDDFQVDFPIDLVFYENYTEIINTETGVTANNPELVIDCSINNVRITANKELLTPEKLNLQMISTLNEKIISFSDQLKNSVSGSKTERELITSTENTDNSEQWTANSFIFIIVIIIFTLVTSGDTTKLSEIEKQVRKINKKYREWIVEVDRSPKRPLGAELINLKSVDDLIKISEELGKSVIYHESETDGTYSYYVLDETVHYKFVFYDKEKFIKHFVDQKENTQNDFFKK